MSAVSNCAQASNVILLKFFRVFYNGLSAIGALASDTSYIYNIVIGAQVKSYSIEYLQICTGVSILVFTYGSSVDRTYVIFLTHIWNWPWSHNSMIKFFADNTIWSKPWVLQGLSSCFWHAFYRAASNLPHLLDVLGVKIINSIKSREYQWINRVMHNVQCRQLI